VKNAYGHIIRWRERSSDYAGQRLTWDLFMLAGPGEDRRGPDGKPMNQDKILACPDGLWFDPDGRLWSQTDMSG
ncbi:alkaline phosphatase PhoX, partial [Pseudomonas aeruginosa]